MQSLRILALAGLAFASPALADDAFENQKKQIEQQQRALYGLPTETSGGQPMPNSDVLPPVATPMPEGPDALGQTPRATQPQQRQHWENIEGLGAFDIIDMKDDQSFRNSVD